MKMPLEGLNGIRRPSEQGQEMTVLHQNWTCIELPAKVQENLGDAINKSLCPYTLPGSCLQGCRRFWITAGYWHIC